MTQNGPIYSDPDYLELRDRFAGLLVLVTAMALCVCLSFWAKGRARPEWLGQSSPATLRGIVGWPHAIEAIATLEAARRVSRPRELKQIVLEGVKSDGTIDVVTGPGALSYLFHNNPKKPRPPKLPDGKPGEPKVAEAKTLDRPVHCPRQLVQVREDGIDPQPEMKDMRCPANATEPLPVPACSPRDVWLKGIAKGASIRELAHMEYYRAAAGPAWKMVLPRNRFRLVLSGDCTRELGRVEAQPL